MRQRVIAVVGVVALIGLVFALNFYRLPVVALSPGPMEDVLARLKVEGSRVYDSEGKLYLTSVGIDDNVRFYEALLDMANRDVQLVPRAQLYPEEQDSAEIDKENVALMDRSKETATVVALRQVGYKIEPSGVEVTEVVAGAPADGKLRAGDEILAADGHLVDSTDEVRKAITGHKPGERVAFRVERGKGEKNVSVEVQEVEDQPRVGILLRDLFPNLPVKVTIQTQNNIGGPSAGLMFTLSIIDKLTRDDLTGGRRIAGTGEIALDGSVLPVGGVGEKLIAVHRLGVTTFLIPAENCAGVKGQVPDGLRLVKVSKVDDALRFLRDPKAAASAPGC
ncbi:MAG TPA: S16 family serine protease [Actinomycetota bacterium]